MTNSEKPSNPAPARPRRGLRWTEPLVELSGLAIGWLAILRITHWRFTVAVFFLLLGWAAVVTAVRFLWAAAFAATGDADAPPADNFGLAPGRREDLLLEKRSLLKAIKEIEFDHQMGKMSDGDAADITRLYRARAIEVMKALEEQEPAAPAAAAARREAARAEIEREIERRLARPEGEP
jgi:hypothetical protein